MPIKSAQPNAPARPDPTCVACSGPRAPAAIVALAAGAGRPSSVQPPASMVLPLRSRLGSLTKAFLDVVVVQRDGEGQLHLSGTPSKHVPNDPQADQFRLRQPGRMTARQGSVH